MFFLKLIMSFGICFVAQLLWSKSALAWGPGVHTVTALSVLDEIELVLPAIGRIITSFPLQYLYGCLSADFFIGKTKRTNAQHLHNWKGGFTLISRAHGDREAAYAYGFLSHLAADVISHNFFIPNLIESYPIRSRIGHLYWETKADYFVGPEYIKTAKEVLAMEHRGCDGLLKLSVGKGKNGLKAKKRVFTQSVKLSDYVCATHPMLFEGKVIRWQVFHEYLLFMLELSCQLVKDFLKHPESSVCLLYDPMGKQRLHLAKRKIFSISPLRRRRPIQRFTVDQKLLEL